VESEPTPGEQRDDVDDGQLVEQPVRTHGQHAVVRVPPEIHVEHVRGEEEQDHTREDSHPPAVVDAVPLVSDLGDLGSGAVGETVGLPQPDAKGAQLVQRFLEPGLELGGLLLEVRSGRHAISLTGSVADRQNKQRFLHCRY